MSGRERGTFWWQLSHSQTVSSLCDHYECVAFITCPACDGALLAEEYNSQLDSHRFCHEKWKEGCTCGSGGGGRREESAIYYADPLTTWYLFYPWEKRNSKVSQATRLQCGNAESHKGRCAFRIPEVLLYKEYGISVTWEQNKTKYHIYLVISELTVRDKCPF